MESVLQFLMLNHSCDSTYEGKEAQVFMIFQNESEKSEDEVKLPSKGSSSKSPTFTSTPPVSNPDTLPKEKVTFTGAIN